MTRPLSAEPTIICITPVRDEEWILERFLDAATVWADLVIVLDQCSTDRSRAIAAAHSNVQLILDEDPGYDELRRQRMLLAAARRVPGRRVIFALDADEALSANVLRSPSWERALSAEPGTVLRLPWLNLLPGFEHAWVPSDPIAFGFVDDGREHVGSSIHSTRIPSSPHQPSEIFVDAGVLHYQFAAWSRMCSKQRWYQCWERIHHPSKRPVQLYRQYHFMHALASDQVRRVEPSWFDIYERAGLDMRSASEQEWYPWDEQVLEWLIEHGPERFARLDIWEVDWQELARVSGRCSSATSLRDPRGPGTRLVHRWLARTQARASRASVRLAQRAMIPLGW